MTVFNLLFGEYFVATAIVTVLLFCLINYFLLFRTSTHVEVRP